MTSNTQNIYYIMCSPALEMDCSIAPAMPVYGLPFLKSLLTSDLLEMQHKNTTKDPKVSLKTWHCIH